MAYAGNIKIFMDDVRGSTVVVFALALPVLLLVVGGTLDYSQAVNQRQRLQAVIDKAALDAGRALSLSDAKQENVAAAVEAIVSASSKANGNDRFPAPSMQTTIRKDPLEVHVVARQTTVSNFGSMFGLAPTELEVSATARVIGNPNICLLSLEKYNSDALKVDKKSNLTGNRCSVFSNSKSSESITVKGGARLTADTICSAGGVKASGVISPVPFLDCPQFEDPLASRPEPPIGGCSYNEFSIKKQARTIKPGVYCGGLEIEQSEITFAPGLYIIKGGDFEVKDHSVIRGKGVSFYLDRAAKLKIDKETTIELEASESGPLAGLLFFASRQQSEKMEHKILSRKAHKLLGTLYFPKNALIIGSEYGEGANVGSAAAFTAIVAREVIVKNKSIVTLNSNYDDTDVPVPEGIRGAGRPVSLVE